MGAVQPASAPPPSQTVRVEVHRVAEGQAAIVRVLSPVVDGIITHWIRGRGQYCPGEETCPPANHRFQSYWKGYVAAHVFTKEGNRWLPRVLEITESLELDLRHVYRPGQTWEVFRRPRAGKKIYPVEGRLIEDCTSPPPGKVFPILPILQNFYHAPGLVLGQKNPMPERIVCEILESVAPLFKLPSEKPAEPSPEEIERMREQRKKLKGMFGNR